MPWNWWRVCLAAALLAVGSGWSGPVWAVPVHVMESLPAASAVMSGSNTEFFVRFDGPVDHAASSFSVVREGRVLEVLHPRLESEPNVLYSGVPKLAPGNYTLRWATRSMLGRDDSQGEIAFSVK